MSAPARFILPSENPDFVVTQIPEYEGHANSIRIQQNSSVVYTSLAQLEKWVEEARKNLLEPAPQPPFHVASETFDAAIKFIEETHQGKVTLVLAKYIQTRKDVCAALEAKGVKASLLPAIGFHTQLKAVLDSGLPAILMTSPAVVSTGWRTVSDRVNFVCLSKLDEDSLAQLANRVHGTGTLWYQGQLIPFFQPNRNGVGFLPPTPNFSEAVSEQLTLLPTTQPAKEPNEQTN